MEEERWIYEVVDNTDDCTYYTIAVFLESSDVFLFLEEELVSSNKMSMYTDSDREKIQVRAVRTGPKYKRVVIAEYLRQEAPDHPGWKTVYENKQEEV